MEKQALEFIQSNAIYDKVAEQLASATPEQPNVVLPEGMTLTSVESRLPKLNRFKERFKTESIDDFVVYNQKHTANNALCCIDAGDSDLSATTTFDRGDTDTPLHRDHSAQVSLRPSMGYRTLLNAAKKYSQLDISNWIEDNDMFLTIVGEDESVISNKLAAKALREISIEQARSVDSSVDNFGSTMSALEKIEAKSSEARPAYILFKCVPYLGFSEYTFTLRVSILTGEAKPVISLSFVQIEHSQERISDEFVGILSDGLKETEIETYRGSIR